MRLSSNKDDAGYSGWRSAMDSGKTIHVFLDGVEQTKCSIADTDLGVVERCVLTDDGRVQVDPNKPDEIWIERVEGDVRIVIG